MAIPRIDQAETRLAELEKNNEIISEFDKTLSQKANKVAL